MPDQFLPFIISRKTAFIGILNMMIIVGQCAPYGFGPSFDTEFDSTASSTFSEDSLYNYHTKGLSIAKYKSQAHDDKYLTFTKRDISDQSTFSSFKSESPEPGSLFLRIRKRDDDEEPADNEEEPKPEAGENEEEPKPESEGDEEPKPESGENEESSAHEHNEEEPESLVKEESSHEGLTEESMPLSTSNLEESPALFSSDQEGMPYSKNQDTLDEDFAFQKKPLPSEFLKQKGKSPVSNKNGNHEGPFTADGLDSGPNEFLTEENWDEYSFYPRSFPSVWKGKKSRTVKPLQPMVSWNEFLVMQDRFQKQKLNLNPTSSKNGKLNSLFHKSKDNLYSYVENALMRNQQIEKELMDLKRMLQKSASEQKSSAQWSGFPRIINNTLQLNVPLLQKGRIMPQEFKIKIEAQAPLKIKTQVGDGKDGISINGKPLRLEERSSEDLNATSINKIQVREILTSTKIPDILAVSIQPIRDLSSMLAASPIEESRESDDKDPLKAERTAFIRKGAEFLRRAWLKYKQKRYLFLQ